MSRVESYVTTYGQSASLSWNKAPNWGLRPDFYYCRTVASMFMWGALSDEGLSFTIAVFLTSAVTLRSVSCGTRDHIILSQIWNFPFCRLIRLVGLRWRYSTQLPHGINSLSESESLDDRRFTAKEFVLVPSPLRLTARIFFFSMEHLRP
jgi:hypothetical protein